LPIKPAFQQRRLPQLFGILLLALLSLSAWQWRNGPPVAASLLALLPSGAGDTLVQQAEARMQEPIQQDVLVLVGHPERARAVALAAQLGQQWRNSGQFEKVRWQVETDLQAVRQYLRDNRLNLMSSADRQWLIEQPQQFIQQRVASLLDPFATGLLAPEQDWLGLATRAQEKLNVAEHVQVDLSTGSLLIEEPGMTWVLLQLRSREHAFDMQTPQLIAQTITAGRASALADGGQLLATGGMLYAAAGQRKAMEEMTLIGGAASIGTLLLLLLAFRRPRVLLSLLPVAVALLSGSATCVLLFGQINALTLVIGASLIGVAADYPLHYLSKSWGHSPWRSWAALNSTLPGLSLSLGTNLIGYLALAFTPFPALTQIAAFSAAGLIAAYLCSVCLLPAWLNGMLLHPAPRLLRLARYLLHWHARLDRRRGWLLALFLLFCFSGLWQLHSQNDLRQWLGTDPELLSQSQRIVALTGQQPTSQFFLLRATDQEQLLERQQALGNRLDELIQDGQLRSYRSLNQLLATPTQMQALHEALTQLPHSWQALLDLGVPLTALQAERQQLLQQRPSRLDQALSSPLAEPWRPLWLGHGAEGVAAIVSLQGQPPTAQLEAAAAGLEGVQLIDRLGELNTLFAVTQLSAAELKLLSCLAILLLLCLPFGLSGALRVVCLPLLAAMATLASLGWLGQPLTLFSLFGLLLVTAIGVDYAILMRESIGGRPVSLLGTLLSAISSWLSFGLLLLSQTPAIANFGLAISLGLLFCFLLSPWACTHAQQERRP
jgi:predicted exporter